jgi:hypothetical protein
LKNKSDEEGKKKQGKRVGGEKRFLSYSQLAGFENKKGI